MMRINYGREKFQAIKYFIFIIINYLDKLNVYFLFFYN
jgi:hypothetical protein